MTFPRPTAFEIFCNLGVRLYYTIIVQHELGFFAPRNTKVPVKDRLRNAVEFLYGG
jgi:hypothetical protein